MRHGLAVARFAVGLAVISLVAWLAGLAAYWALLSLSGETEAMREVRVIGIWSGIGLVLAVPFIYFPALTVLESHTSESPEGMLLRVLACAILGIVPAVLLVGWMGGSGSVTMLFWGVFAVDGAVLACGHWLLTRTKEATLQS